MNNDIDNAIKKAISNIERIHGIVSTDIQRSLDIAIKALEEKVNDPRNDHHYDECDYCKYSECSSDEYPCCECSHAVDFLSKWEKVE